MHEDLRIVRLVLGAVQQGEAVREQRRREEVLVNVLAAGARDLVGARDLPLRRRRVGVLEHRREFFELQLAVAVEVPRAKGRHELRLLEVLEIGPVLKRAVEEAVDADRPGGLAAHRRRASGLLVAVGEDLCARAVLRRRVGLLCREFVGRMILDRQLERLEEADRVDLVPRRPRLLLRALRILDVRVQLLDDRLHLLEDLLKVEQRELDHVILKIVRPEGLALELRDVVLRRRLDDEAEREPVEARGRVGDGHVRRVVARHNAGEHAEDLQPQVRLGIVLERLDKVPQVLVRDLLEAVHLDEAVLDKLAKVLRLHLRLDAALVQALLVLYARLHQRSRELEAHPLGQRRRSLERRDDPLARLLEAHANDLTILGALPFWAAVCAAAGAAPRSRRRAAASSALSTAAVVLVISTTATAAAEVSLDRNAALIALHNTLILLTAIAAVTVITVGVAATAALLSPPPLAASLVITVAAATLRLLAALLAAALLSAATTTTIAFILTAISVSISSSSSVLAAATTASAAAAAAISTSASSASTSSSSAAFRVAKSLRSALCDRERRTRPFERRLQLDDLLAHILIVALNKLLLALRLAEHVRRALRVALHLAELRGHPEHLALDVLRPLLHRRRVIRRLLEVGARAGRARRDARHQRVHLLI